MRYCVTAFCSVLGLSCTSYVGTEKVHVDCSTTEMLGSFVSCQFCEVFRWRMLCKCENLEEKLLCKTTLPSVKVLSNKISLSSLHFNSCTTKMLHMLNGLPLNIAVQFTNPNTFTTFNKETINTVSFGPS